MTSFHPIVEAANLGECWLAVSQLILDEGVDSRYDDQPIKEISRLTLSAASPDRSDPIIDRHGDPAMPLTDASYIPCVSLLDFWVREGLAAAR